MVEFQYAGVWLRLDSRHPSYRTVSKPKRALVCWSQFARSSTSSDVKLTRHRATPEDVLQKPARTPACSRLAGTQRAHWRVSELSRSRSQAVGPQGQGRTIYQ